MGSRVVATVIIYLHLNGSALLEMKPKKAALGTISFCIWDNRKACSFLRTTRKSVVNWVKRNCNALFREETK